MKEILMVLTSHAELGNSGEETGFWLEEFAAPYYAFVDNGAHVTIASVNGGRPPLDPKSNAPDAQTEATERFMDDTNAQCALVESVALADVKAEDFDAVFYPGGHGLLWDLVESETSRELIEAFVAAGKPCAFVCHAPAVLRDVRRADGAYFVADKSVTGFSNSEEAALGLTDVVPFLIEDMLRERGGEYSKGDDWQSFVCHDANLITGQNPASSAATANALLKALTV